ncbi:MAG: phosphopantetheine-binding protein [Planctomycetota bacterium]
MHERIKKLIVEKLRLPDVTPESIDDDTPLFGPEGLGLDSVDALELVVGLEKEFGIKIRSPEAERDAFRTVDSLVDLVRRHLEGGEAREATVES